MAGTFDGNVISRDGADISWSRPRNYWAWLRTTIHSIVAALLLTCPHPGEAQEKPIEIGVLALGPRPLPAWHCGPGDYRLASTSPQLETVPFFVLGFRDELENLKYVEDRPEHGGKSGRRFHLDLGIGTLQEVRSFAREFVRKRVDIIFAVAPATVQVAKEETQDSPIPIVMAGVSDPVGDGYVRSLARPGGFITGVSHQMVQGSGKRVELFKQMIPGLQRLITIRRPGYRASEESMADIRAVASELRLQVLDWGVASRDELRSTLSKAHWQAGDGIMILSDSLVISNADLILEIGLEQRIPVFGPQDFMADWGAVAAYGPSPYEVGVHDARYVDKINKGAKVGDLPIEPIDPTFVINLKAAECLGISVPLELLHQADRVIR
jgi:putative ABC transport system substrate-binding protein